MDIRFRGRTPLLGTIVGATLLAALTGAASHAPGGSRGDGQELVLAPAAAPPARAEILASLQALVRSQAGATTPSTLPVAATGAAGDGGAAAGADGRPNSTAAASGDSGSGDNGGSRGGDSGTQVGDGDGASLEPQSGSDPPAEPAPTRPRATATPTTGAAPDPVPTTAAPPAPGTLTRLPNVELEVLTLTNRDRGANGANAVYREGCMDSEASAWARSMAENMTMVHSPGAGDAVQGCRGSNAYWGDNIGHWQPCNASSMEDWWMASPSHRPHILDPTYTAVGIGVWAEPSGRCWFQVYFGS